MEANAQSSPPQLINHSKVLNFDISMIKNANMAQITPLFNVNQFISDVFHRPALWHRSYFMSRFFLEETWDELSEKHAIPKYLLKTKWRTLRSTFVSELRRVPRDEVTGNFLIPPEDLPTKWLHYKPLCFLAKHIQLRPRHYGVNNTGVPKPLASDLQMPHSATSQQAKRSAVELTDEYDCDPKDDDTYFLMSLHPYMGYLGAEQKLRVRMAFHKVMFEELYKGDSSKVAMQNAETHSENN